VSGLALGPVSEVLEKELRDQVRRHGIVMWLDADGRYQSFVERLVAARAEGSLPYEVRRFRGSFLELMVELAPLSRGTDREHLVVHLPGFHEESLRETPLLELRRAGTRFQKALDTLVAEAAARRVAPERIEELVKRPELSLEAADGWLADALRGPEGGMRALLSVMSPQALIDDLLLHRGVVNRLGGDYPSLFAHLEAALGLPEDWVTRTFPRQDERPADAAFAAASWALSVEYVDDLSRPPTIERLARAAALLPAVTAECCGLCVHLRKSHADFYEQTARQTEEDLLSKEVSIARAADLGKIDTFPFEDEVVLDEALDALRQGAFTTAHTWTEQRIDGRSFWLERKPSRKSEWQLVGAAATLGLAIDRAGPRLNAKSLEDAAARYADAGAAVDRAHRQLEQLRHALLFAQLDRFDELRPLLDEMRERWRAWADGWARDFNQLCRAEGFLPAPELRQRGLFEEVVRPLTGEGRTAFFVVDALRFEMAEELRLPIADTPATEVRLGLRFAELPSNTEVGMNVLAPVAQKGRLAPAVEDGRFVGFSSHAAGEFRVHNPETRRRAMQDRIGGATAPWLTLGEVLSRDTQSLKRAVANARLVVVHSEEIDKAGERDFGPKVFDQILRQLRSAWRQLREAGVQHFVISADHGFLLLHDRAEHAQAHGRKIDPKRRHVVSTVAADHSGEVRVRLSDLGYEGVDDLHLMFPETTAAFDTGKRGGDFVHGGNSLQERIIPVLTVSHRVAAGGSSLRYRVDARREPGIAGMHCLVLRVEVAAQEALAFARDAEIELALRSSDPTGLDVDLVQARRDGRIVGSSIHAPVGKDVEVFFRLLGPSDARAQVEVFHAGAGLEVEGCVIAERFEVASDGTKIDKPATAPGAKAPESPPVESTSWLEVLPEGGVRVLFLHLSQHGTVSEAEATRILGGARKLRQFSTKFEQYAAHAPFSVRIEMIAGVKTYLREGSGP
jgi:hypothetical protein